MSTPDVFNSDLFSLRNLTASLKRIPYTPSVITGMNLFETKGIDTTAVFIDIGNKAVNLVASTERGAPPAVVVGDKFESRPFQTIHLPQRSTLLADAVQNVRSFDSEDSTDGVQMKITELLEKHKRNIVLTKENLMFGAVKGLVTDADGSTLLDLHAAMGTAPTEYDFELDNDSTEVRNKIVQLERLIEDRLDGIPFTSVEVLCGHELFDALVAHPEVKATWVELNSSENNRANLRRGFSYAGMMFREYRPGQGVTIEPNEGWAIPMGVDSMFLGRYAPADYNETVNTMGLPFYSKSRELPYGKGMEIETQSNPLFLCTRPNAVPRIGLNAAALA